MSHYRKFLINNNLSLKFSFILNQNRGCDEYMFEGQGDIQLYFVLIALLCIPWMLLGKPLYIMTCGQKPKHVSILENMTQIENKFQNILAWRGW